MKREQPPQDESVVLERAVMERVLAMPDGEEFPSEDENTAVNRKWIEGNDNSPAFRYRQLMESVDGIELLTEYKEAEARGDIGRMQAIVGEIIVVCKGD